MPLGERLRALREERGLGPGELSKRSGVSRPYLWQLESGKKTRPTMDILERLAQALGVTVADFVGSQVVEPGESGWPEGLTEFHREHGEALGVTRTDLESMARFQFRGKQPEDPRDWLLLYLFLRKWVR